MIENPSNHLLMQEKECKRVSVHRCKVRMQVQKGAWSANKVQNSGCKIPYHSGCQRGQRLCKYIVSLFSKTGDTIVDLFAGTGTLGLIAAVMERNVIIFEKDKLIYKKLLEPYSTKVNSKNNQ